MKLHLTRPLPCRYGEKRIGCGVHYNHEGHATVALNSIYIQYNTMPSTQPDHLDADMLRALLSAIETTPPKTGDKP